MEMFSAYSGHWKKRRRSRNRKKGRDKGFSFFPRKDGAGKGK
jgi:hypothetical protein